MARSRRSAATSGPALLALGAVLLLVAVALAGVRPFQATAPVGVTRSFYIAADPVLWNYTPSGTNEITGQPLGAGNSTERLYTERNATYLGTSFEKCIYRQYADASFTTLLPRPPSQAYLGLLGPVIYAAVGDTIQVTFRNNCPLPESIAPSGVEVAPSSDGTNYNGSVYYGGSVPTNGTVQYTWAVPPSAGPAGAGATSTVWLYQSGTEPTNSSDLGLLGPIVISGLGMDNPNGTPAGGAANVLLLFSTIDENNSTYQRYNVEHFAEDPALVNLTQPTWLGSLRKYSINGFLYGNLPVLTFPHGAEIVWWLMDLGEGYHTASFEGNLVRVGGARTSSVGLVPEATTRAVMWANASGDWLVDSTVPADLPGGMEGEYEVAASATTAAVGAAMSAGSPHEGRTVSGEPSPAPEIPPGLERASLDRSGVARWV
jgi:manganese oxidase